MLSIGRADGNTLTLDDASVAPWHARVTADSRGLVLDVLDRHARTHVNARPVVKMALLRPGDQVSLGSVTILLQADGDHIDMAEILSGAGVDCVTGPPLTTVVLRGMTGSCFGHSLGVSGGLHIGNTPGCDVRLEGGGEWHGIVEPVGDMVRLRMLVGECQVNGVPRRQSLLFAGDQLTFGNSHRFVLEAPGLATREQVRRRLDDEVVTPPVVAQDPAGWRGGGDDDARQLDGPSDRSSVWWLIGIAALISAALATLLWSGR